MSGGGGHNCIRHGNDVILAFSCFTEVLTVEKPVAGLPECLRCFLPAKAEPFGPKLGRDARGVKSLSLETRQKPKWPL